MANQTPTQDALIKGAYAAAPKFSNAGSAFASAFEARNQQFEKATKEADAKREELFSLVDNIELDDLGNTPEMTMSIMEKAKDLQNSFFDKVKNTNPFDPTLRLEAAKVSQKINKLQAYSETYKAFIQDFQANKAKASSTNGKDKYQELEDYLSFSLVEDETGDFKYKTKSGKLVSRKELSSYADNLLEVPLTIYKDIADTADRLDGKKPFSVIEGGLRTKLQMYLEDPKYGDDFLFDSLGGKFNPMDANNLGGGFRLAQYQGASKEDILRMAKGDTYEEKINFLKNQVINGYIDAFKKTHLTLADIIQKKQQATASSAKGPNADLNIKGEQIYNTIFQLENGDIKEDFTYRFPGEPQSTPFKIIKRSGGYILQKKGEKAKFITEEQAANIFGQGDVYKKNKEEADARTTREEAASLIANTLGTTPKSPFLGNFGGK